MTSFPQDPYMLLSVVNMKLRDRFSSLDSLCEDMNYNRRVYISASCSHNKPCQRSKAHGCIYNFTVLNCRNGTAVT